MSAVALSHPHVPRWRICDTVAWVDTEPDAIAVVRVDEPNAIPALIPEPYAQLWRALDTPDGADRETLVRVVQNLGGPEPGAIVDEFIAQMTSARLVEAHHATDEVTPSPDGALEP